MKFSRKRSSKIQEQSAKTIAPGPIASVTPITIVLRVLNQRSFTCVQKEIAKRRVLSELCPQRFAHDVFFHSLPILTEGP